MSVLTDKTCATCAHYAVVADDERPSCAALSTARLRCYPSAISHCGGAAWQARDNEEEVEP